MARFHRRHSKLRKNRKTKHRKHRKSGTNSANTKTQIKTTMRLTGVFAGTSTPSDATNGLYVYLTASPWNSGSALNVFQCVDWKAQSALYDEFKISSVKLKWKPLINQTTITQAQQAPLNASSSVFSWVDRDGSSIVPKASGDIKTLLSKYESLRENSIYRTFHRSLKVKPVWVNTSFNPSTPVNPQYQYLQNAGYFQTVSMYANNMPVPSGLTALSLGEYLVEFKVQFRGKKPVMLAYDDNTGSIIMTPLTSLPPQDIIQPTVLATDPTEMLYNLSLTDMSGNVIAK